MQRIDKPWGFEEWLEVNERYVLKTLFMKKGARCSLQYHEFKHETIYVLRGELRIKIGDISRIYTAGEYVAIEPGIIHRMEGVTDALYLEASTPELQDVVRIEDDYIR